MKWRKEGTVLFFLPPRAVESSPIRNAVTMEPIDSTVPHDLCSHGPPCEMLRWAATSSRKWLTHGITWHERINHTLYSSLDKIWDMRFRDISVFNSSFFWNLLVSSPDLQNYDLCVHRNIQRFWYTFNEIGWEIRIDIWRYCFMPSFLRSLCFACSFDSCTRLNCPPAPRPNVKPGRPQHKPSGGGFPFSAEPHSQRFLVGGGGLMKVLVAGPRGYQLLAIPCFVSGFATVAFAPCRTPQGVPNPIQLIPGELAPVCR